MCTLSTGPQRELVVIIETFGELFGLDQEKNRKRAEKYIIKRKKFPSACVINNSSNANKHKRKFNCCKHFLLYDLRATLSVGPVFLY